MKVEDVVGEKFWVLRPYTVDVGSQAVTSFDHRDPDTIQMVSACFPRLQALLLIEENAVGLKT